jgi:hypothetical protein
LNQNVIRVPGGEWTPLDFSASTTSCLNSVSLNFASQTFVLGAGNRLEVETYVHQAGSGANLYAMLGSGATTAALIAAQSDGDWILYEITSTGGSYNPVVSFPGSSAAHQVYTGSFKMNMNIVCLGSSSTLIDAQINGWYTGVKYSSAFNLDGTVSIAVDTDAVGNCSGRARLLV